MALHRQAPGYCPLPPYTNERTDLGRPIVVAPSVDHLKAACGQPAVVCERQHGHCTSCGMCAQAGTVCRDCTLCVDCWDADEAELEAAVRCGRWLWDRFLRRDVIVHRPSLFDVVSGRWSR